MLGGGAVAEHSLDCSSVRVVARLSLDCSPYEGGFNCTRGRLFTFTDWRGSRSEGNRSWSIIVLLETDTHHTQSLRCAPFSTRDPITDLTCFPTLLMGASLFFHLGARSFSADTADAGGALVPLP